MNMPLESLLDWYTNLKPDNLHRVAELYAPDAHFRDPFNNVTGTQAIERIFQHMFDNTDNPRFIVRQLLLEGDQAFVTWVFEFSLQNKPYRVEGASHIGFNQHGLVADHRDYWDPAEELFQKLPFIGRLVSMLRKRFSATGTS